MKIKRTENAKRNIYYGILLKFYQMGMPFVMRTLMIYLLGVQYLGLNSLFVSVLQVLNLAELGVGSAMVYSMYKPIAEDDETMVCALMNLYKKYYRIIGLVVFIAGMLLVPFIPKMIFGSIPAGINIYIIYFLNLSATVLTYWLFAYKNSILDAHQKKYINSQVILFTDTLKYIFQIVSIAVFKSYYLYLIVTLISQIITNILTAIVANKIYPRYKAVGNLSRETKQTINERIKDLFITKIGTTIINSSDTVVISAFLGLTVLAIYQNYFFIVTSVISLFAVLFNSIVAGIGNSMLTESKEKNYSDFNKFTFMISWLTGIAVSCFLCLYQPFMELWVGKELMLNFSFVVLFCMYFYIYQTTIYLSTYKDATGIWHSDRFRPFITGVTNLFLNLIMVRYLGLYGILLSTIITTGLISFPWLVNNLFKQVFYRRKSEYIKKFLLYSMVIIIAATGSYYICSFIPNAGIPAFILKIIISVLASNIIMGVILFRTEDMKKALLFSKQLLIKRKPL